MKNYIITSNEYEIILRRLSRLNEKKQMLKASITKITQTISDDPTHSNVINDKMTNYVAALEELDKEIEELESEAVKLKSDLDYMDSRLSNINEIKEQVFVMYFIRGLKPLQIAPKIPCSKSSVYRYIDEINVERESWEKIRKENGYNDNVE